MWFYTRAFVGVGFDYSVIALKIGIYGQLDLDSYNYFLTRTYAAGQDLKAQRTTLHAELGLKFVAQLLFLNIESTFLSTDQISIDGSVCRRRADVEDRRYRGYGKLDGKDRLPDGHSRI